MNMEIEGHEFFSADGKWIVFSGNFHGEPGAERAATHTYEVEIAKAK